MGLDIALDLKLYTMKSADDFILRDDAAGDHFSRLVEYTRCLEQEKNKIDAFKRELPISVLLISHVIGFLRDEMDQCRGVKTLKGKSEEQGGVISESDNNKISWMSSAQLWSGHNCTADSTGNTKSTEKDEEIDRSIESKPPEAGRGVIVSFKGINEKKLEKPAVALTGFSLLPQAAMKNSSRVVPDVHEDNRSAVKNTRAAAAASGAHLSLESEQQQQMSRKARRCWSPELHRRFVLALQQLGGAQVATPKQIRELMKVDGLTNDEVKSHLQKYRLHTRRMPNSTTSSTSKNPAVWVGGLWLPQEQKYKGTSQRSGSQSGSPQGPLQLTTASNGAGSLTAGDSYEEEDGKSESYSWK